MGLLIWQQMSNLKKVVIKQLKKDMLKETRKKLFYEEKILKSLDHPAIPNLLENLKRGQLKDIFLNILKEKHLINS